MYGSQYGPQSQFGGPPSYGAQYGAAAGARPNTAAFGTFPGPAGGYGTATLGSFGATSAQVTRPGVAGAPPAFGAPGAPPAFQPPADFGASTSGGLPRSNSFNPPPTFASTLQAPPGYAPPAQAPPAPEQPSPSPVPPFQQSGLSRSASFNSSFSGSTYAQSNALQDSANFKTHSSFGRKSAAFMPGNRMEHASSYTDPKRPGTFVGPTTLKSTPGPGAYNPPTSSFLKSPLSASPKSLRK